MVAVDVVEGDVAGLPHDIEARGRGGGDQVAGDLGLAIGGDTLAGRAEDVDRDDVAVADEDQPVVRQAFRPAACVEPQAGEQVGHRRLEDAGADARLDPCLAGPLDDRRGDTRLAQRVAEEQPRRAGPDDRDLRLHSCRSSASRTR